METRPKVLLVDDEEVTRMLIAAFFKRLPYDLTAVASGEEALDLLADQDDAFDVMLLDIMMPGLDGFEVLKRLKQQPATAQIKVIMLTAINPVKEKVKAFAAGASDYIVKPFQKDELLARIETQVQLRQAERALQRANDELELKVAQRTAELRQANAQLRRELNERQQAEEALRQTQMQLLHSQKMASIGQLAAGVAHEINNPVAFVLSNLETLQRYERNIRTFLTELAPLFAGPPSPNGAGGDILRSKWQALAGSLKIDFILDDMEKLTADCLRGTERVMNIVLNMRSYAHIDEQQWQVVDLNSVLEDSLTICWNELKYKATVVKQFGSPPPVWGLPQQLSQVFVNLLVNAAQAVGEKSTIEIKTAAYQNQAQAIVRDDGPGIPPEILDRIFEPFFTTKEVGEGTGLGLSLSYDIIKGHNGSITVESAPGLGTTFTVLLPGMRSQR